MAFPLRRARLWLVLVAMPLLRLSATPLPPPETAVALLPATAAFAARDGLAIEGTNVASEAGPGREGDALTVLVTLRNGKVLKQWLSHFEIAPLTERERAEHVTQEQTMTSSAGRVIRFAGGNRLALDIRTIGPFVTGGTKEPEDKHARALISPDLLALGLDQTCRTLIRLAEESRSKEGLPSAAPGAPPKVVSEADERAVAGFFPALVAFFQTAQNTPGLREILWAILKTPSAWSVIKNAGKIDLSINLDKYSASPLSNYPGWTESELPLFRLSPEFTLNQQPALVCSLFVTTPRPPLLTTAGIIGIVAETPGRTDRHLDIRILAGRRAALKSPPVSP